VRARARRSNLDVRFGSGSVWSKRERLAVRRSVSSIVSKYVVVSLVVEVEDVVVFLGEGGGRNIEVQYHLEALRLTHTPQR
jgi:hypothetical protein